MLETNIFVFLFYSREIHVMQRDFEILALVLCVDHRWTCHVTLFCVVLELYFEFITNWDRFFWLFG